MYKNNLFHSKILKPYTLFLVPYLRRLSGSVAQTVDALLQPLGPSSHLDRSTWISWWTKQSMDSVFSGFIPFFPVTNFIPTFLHTHLIHFIRPCHGPSEVVGRPSVKGLHRISSFDQALSRTRVEDIYLS